MFICPKCNVKLVKTKSQAGIFWLCPSCNGRSATVSFLRNNMPRDVVNSLWQTARSGEYPQVRHCPACNKMMSEVPAEGKNNIEYIDVCTVCQFVWFDANEFESLPAIPKKSIEKELPQATREKLAIIEVNAIREAAENENSDNNSPDDWWLWIPGLLGMPIEQNQKQIYKTPWITWSLTLLICLVSIVAFFDLDVTIEKFGLIPAYADRYIGATFFTSFLLHGSVLHLFGNIYFFLIFGDNVEEWLGKLRFLLLIILSALIGDIFHIIADQSSTIPCIGASGGISGVITFYALKFPRVRLGFLFSIAIWFRWIMLPAYVMFLMWIGLQLFGVWEQFNGVSNVSSMAHLGGVFVGFIFWLLTKKE